MEKIKSPGQSAAPEPPPAADASPYALFQNPNFTRFLIGRLAITMGTQMLAVAVDWELYQRTHSALALGFVGLSLMVPMILCTIPAGHFADVFNRKSIMLAATLLLAAASLGLALISEFKAPVGCMYACLVVVGVARTFQWPASAAFLPSLVPRHLFPKAVTFNSGTFQLSSVLGPAVCGWLYSVTGHAAIIYSLNALACLIFFALVISIPHQHTPPERQPVTLKTLIAGFNFVYANKIILGTVSLDMFAVLLGGAVSLLPIFAGDILNFGANGLGLLRAAMPIGAVLCAFWLTHRPPLQKAGRAMLLSVAIFGLATILFGVGNSACLGHWLRLTLPGTFWFWFSFTMLAISGAVDNVSVVVRQTLVQLLTPDDKRGRVSAVNSLFIGTSNELGGFESGLVAWLGGTAIGHTVASGAIFSTVTGGIGTIIVVILIAKIWPEIRRYGKLA